MSLPKNGVVTDKAGNPVLAKDDLLMQILEVVGTPTKDDLSFLSDEEAIEYINYVSNKRKKHPRMNFHSEYPTASKQIIDLLDNIL